ncbi:PREDICTED: uncharacterized protein LOC105369018 [Ceratosolen solmsi marchali]|uniref:Uncharacterized protein LOC105369018 n=1 Tax=Ceratosolen solmsi marchali TaxID=326594 RepID=A0AAJ6YY91_9HYME|nr:PREDICTED: uncharacterized protein LOC105369018 [Ceratosolen solmsi marchali]
MKSCRCTSAGDLDCQEQPHRRHSTLLANVLSETTRDFSARRPGGGAPPSLENHRWKMYFPLALFHLVSLTWIVISIGATEVRSEPQPIARPTRPKVFTSPDELKEYLDNIKIYYTLNGKARYGKRADPHPMQPTFENPSNFPRMILAISQQNQWDQQGDLALTDKEDKNKLQIMYPYERMTRYGIME